MNGNALRLPRVIEKHKEIGLDTAPFVLLENHALRAVTSAVTLAEILAKPFADKKLFSG